MRSAKVGRATWIPYEGRQAFIISWVRSNGIVRFRANRNGDKIETDKEGHGLLKVTEGKTGRSHVYLAREWAPTLQVAMDKSVEIIQAEIRSLENRTATLKAKLVHGGIPLTDWRKERGSGIILGTDEAFYDERED